MAPPTPLACSHSNCDFETPPGTPTWDLMANILATHTQAVHGGGGGQGQPAAVNSKLEKLPQPVFTLRSSPYFPRCGRELWLCLTGHLGKSQVR